MRETIRGRVSQDTGRVFLEEMQITDGRAARGRPRSILACGTVGTRRSSASILIERLPGSRSKWIRSRIPLSQAPIVEPDTLAW